MSAIDGPISLPPTVFVDDHAGVSSAGAPAGRDGIRARRPLEAAQGPVTPARTPAPFRLPVWPSPGAITLAQDLLDLSQTTFAYTATLTLPETGPDFWDLLAAALPEPERG
ncbi:MAG: hypothetical protein RIC18_06895 [Hoeflea sp.]|uniref:hypothetical protein n=1 Tax=Hoeflea sp. TaxID=1940281 RepID=UPI0032EC9947